MSIPNHGHVQWLPRRPLVTTRTHEAFTFALRRAERLGHDDVTDEHVVLGILEEGHGIAVAVLHHLGVPLDTLTRELEAELPPVGTPRTPASKLSWTRSIERVLEGAVVESRELGTEYYGAEHVLLGILRDPSSATSRVLARHGVAYEDVRREMERVRAMQPGA